MASRGDVERIAKAPPRKGKRHFWTAAFPPRSARTGVGGMGERAQVRHCVVNGLTLVEVFLRARPLPDSESGSGETAAAEE